MADAMGNQGGLQGLLAALKGVGTPTPNPVGTAGPSWMPGGAGSSVPAWLQAIIGGAGGYGSTTPAGAAANNGMLPGSV